MNEFRSRAHAGLSAQRCGRVLLAAGIAGFGLHYLVHVAWASSPAPGPPWYPGSATLSVAAGLALVLAAVGLLLPRVWHWAALGLAAGLIVRTLVFHLPRLLLNVHDPGPWTSGGEILGLGAGALALGAVGLRDRTALNRSIGWVARVLFAVVLFIFGAQHFLYKGFVASLVPRWTPWHLFWAVFFGWAFLAAGIAVLSGVLGALACWLTGFMFLLWFFTLHIPLIVAAPRIGDLWTSAFVPLALAGAALGIGALFSPQNAIFGAKERAPLERGSFSPVRLGRED